MANKTKSTNLGDYVCKIGKYDIRHQISQPSTKNHLVEKQLKTKDQ